MKRPAIFLPLLLAGCIIQPISPAERPHPEGSTCPIPPPPIPKPVWPDSCVADWYAKATLPPCVEDYLQDVKAQQKKLKKHKTKVE